MYNKTKFYPIKQCFTQLIFKKVSFFLLTLGYSILEIIQLFDLRQ